MSKLSRRLLVVGKFAFVIITVMALAYATVWYVAGPNTKALAAVVPEVDCPPNEQEQRVCPLDTTEDKVPEEDTTPEETPDPQPQVLAETTTFPGK